MRKCLILILSLIFVFSTISFGYGATTYELDPFTGAIVGVVGDDQSDVTQTRITNTCVYDKSECEFVYTVSSNEDGEVTCNLYDGEMTSGSVTIVAGAGANINVYLNGEKLKDDDGTYRISTPGEYFVRNMDDDSEVFGFTIFGEVTGASSEYKVPSKFYISSLTINGEYNSTVSNTFNLAKEGSYELIYKSSDLNITRTVRFTVDHTAPELDITGVEDGVASGPVTIGDREEGSTITVTRDGSEINFSSTYQTAGDYVITYTDAAGNSNMYQFHMKVFFNLNAGIVIACFVLLAGAVVFYMVHTRKHMRTF